jgi:hypothetical protein
VYDLTPWLASVLRAVERHRLAAPGAYRRWTLPREGEPEAREPDPYGCADAVNLLYTLGRLPGDPDERATLVGALVSLQDPETGLFREATHHGIHTTAHCVAALELFDARPLHPLRALEPLADPERVEPLLEALEWRSDPWHASHRGAGVYAALALIGRVSPEWEQRYFGWLERETDPETGLLRRGCIGTDALPGIETRFPHLAGTFHYLFNQEHARRPLPYPVALVDSCLAIAEHDPFPLGRTVGFAEIDWVYCLARALRQSGHRFVEGQAALARLRDRYVPWLTALDLERDAGLDDLHRLFGAVCALAELQRALPGSIRSDPPLRLVLDRRPFI